jgi:hypothetical protein
MRLFGLLCAATVIVALQPLAAQTLSYRAENQVPVTLIAVKRTAQFTEVQLRADTDLQKVCWWAAGENSPYLLADGRRYRVLSGANITSCPQRRDYKSNEVMVLRFEPLAESVRQMSLVEGQGGENQMADPASQRGVRYWNFLRVSLP